MYKKYIPFLLLLISTLSFGQNIHFQAIGVENGISQPTVTSIYQDEFGIIWIGTKDGLNRYNGTDFHIFRPIFFFCHQGEIREQCFAVDYTECHYRS